MLMWDKGLGRVERLEGAVRERRLNRLASLLQIKKRHDTKRIGQLRRMDLHEAVTRPRSSHAVFFQVEPRIGNGLHGRLNDDVGLRHGGELVELKSQVVTCESAVHGK
eukprot:6209797-Pleurochrysis_carterae.AAC.1